MKLFFRHVNSVTPWVIIFFIASSVSFAQSKQDLSGILKVTNTEALNQFSQEMRIKSTLSRQQAIEKALQQGWMLKMENEDGSAIELRELGRKGLPVYFSTANLNAAKTVSTNKVWSGGGLGLNLSGSGIVLREWDQSAVRKTHQELTGRVTQGDGVTSLSAHATHVAGTMMATGVVANAHGMSSQASLRAFDWNDDYAEMASEAAAGALLSNHSYVFITGWYNSGSWYWYGDPAISQTEDYNFGFYGDDAAYVDYIAHEAPYYLICRAAGNNKGNGPSSQPVSHYVWDGTSWVLSTIVRNLDGMPSGYDCIPAGFGVSKNILTVGAVSMIPNGYLTPSDVVLASFSSTGPCDDGRIKPDLVADGIGLYSTYSTADNAYASMSGTSMATPGAVGSLGLLQQHYHNVYGTYMLAATLKGLVIHTADEAGSNPGPDYRFGWGLLNTAKAAGLISNTTTAVIKELNLVNGNTFSMNIKANGNEPLRATICWTDIWGSPPPPALNPPDIMLVNDLDIRIDGNTYRPWILDRNNPSAAAAFGDNIRDNTEQILITGIPAGCHVLTVSHKGTLSGGSQAFSLILSGITVYPDLIPGSIAGNQTVCANVQPALITAIPPGGGSSIYTYQWQNSTDNLNFYDIPGATGLNYQPGMLNQTTYYRQLQISEASCHSCTTNVVTVLVNPVPTPTVNGPSSLCANTGLYVYTTESGMNNYLWTVSVGGVLQSGQGSNTIEVNWILAGPQTLSLNYTNGYGCSPFNATTLAVNVDPLPGAAGNIMGPATICAGTTGVSYATEPIAEAMTYLWSLPTGASITSGLGSNAIKVDYADNAVSGNISVYGNNICGNGPPSPDFPVSIQPLPLQPLIIQLDNILISDAPAGNQWYDLNGLIPGATSNVFSPSANGLYMDIVTLEGCSSIPSEWFPFFFTGMDENHDRSVTIYPNPAGSQIHIEIPDNHQEEVRIDLIHSTGKTIISQNHGNLPQGSFNTDLNTENIPDGMYFLKISRGKEVKVSKILIQH